MDLVLGAAPPPPRKRKARELDDEDDTLPVAPPKHLHDSITWDVQAEDMAHHMFCTKFVAIMDTAVESQQWNANIQKKCMELMGELRLRDCSSKDISKHILAEGFIQDPSFIRIMMLKVLYPLRKIQKCDLLRTVVPPEYPGWNYFAEPYPPSKYPTSRSTRRELEIIEERIDKLLKDLHSTIDDIENKLQDVATTKHINLSETDKRKWIQDAMHEIEFETALECEEEMRGLLINIKQRCELAARRHLNLESKVKTSSQETQKGAKSS